MASREWAGRATHMCENVKEEASLQLSYKLSSTVGHGNLPDVEVLGIVSTLAVVVDLEHSQLRDQQYHCMEEHG